ncbi:MAG: hypothetical protein ACKOWE_01485 [Micrococcales bacterium]
MSEWLIAAGLIGLFLGSFMLLEVCKRKFKLSSEITRRIAHVVSGLCGLLDYLLVSKPTFVILMVLGIPFILISYRRNIFTAVHNVVRKTYGELFLAVGIVLAFLASLLEPSSFIPALLIITFSDSLAGLVSDLYKQPRKMIRGSIVFFAVTVVILLSFSVSWAISFLIALALTLVERYSPLGSDNLTVPVAAAALLVLF